MLLTTPLDTVPLASTAPFVPAVPLVNPEKSDTKRGYIYRISSPSGRSYIGQTIQDPKDRWKQHGYSAVNNDQQCRALENAINKYGANKLTYEVIMSINENMLDYYECVFIHAYDALAPNGYNLRDGGNGVCTDDMRKRMVIGNGKKIQNKLWKYDQHPKVKYVCWYHEINKQGNEQEGYRVLDHPNGRDRTFSHSKLTIDERYQAAVAYKTMLDTYVGFYDGRERLPMYMGRHNGTGYKVRYPGMESKYFTTGDLAANKAAAYEHLISICPADQFNRVFKGYDIPN